jgi:hypothetical protein
VKSASQDAAERFPNDIARHELTVLHDSGLYRHLRFARPGTVSMSFSIVTWPGRLCFCGDMGTFVFERLEDMLTFFRHPEPNLGYWAEKCVAQDRSGVKRHDADMFRERASEILRDALEDAPDEKRAAITEAFEERVLYHADDEHSALQAFNEFEEQGFSISDAWEHNFQDWTFHYAWCCHALVWAVARYDEWKSRQAIPLAPGATP